MHLSLVDPGQEAAGLEPLGDGAHGGLISVVVADQDVEVVGGELSPVDRGGGLTIPVPVCGGVHGSDGGRRGGHRPAAPRGLARGFRCRRSGTGSPGDPSGAAA